MENERDEARLKREHAVTIKQLELELAREKYKSEIELKLLEAKWSTWLRIPIIIIRLPVYMLFAIAYCISVICHVEPPKSFWSYLK